MRKLNKQRRADRRASAKGKGEKACSSEEQTVCFPRRRIPCMEAHTLTSMEYRISTRVTFRPLPRCISSRSHHLGALFIFMGVAFGCHSRHLYDATRNAGMAYGRASATSNIALSPIIFVTLSCRASLHTASPTSHLGCNVEKNVLSTSFNFA